MAGGLMQLVAYGAQDIYLMRNISALQSNQIIKWKNEIISFKIPKKTKCPITFDLINISNALCFFIVCL